MGRDRDISIRGTQKTSFRRETDGQMDRQRDKETEDKVAGVIYVAQWQRACCKQVYSSILPKLE